MRCDPALEEKTMQIVQTIPVTQRLVNNVVLDVVPAMGVLLVRQERGAGGGDDDRGPAVVIYPAEIQSLIAALGQAREALAGEIETPAGEP
jgi:hypothetical protein